MSKIAHSITDLIGNTPLLELHSLEKQYCLKARVLAKVEYFNPAGSVKDRAAFSMITEAEKAGRLQPGGTIIEPTSGNTGIGLALVAAVRGYKLILTMPESMSLERRRLLQVRGAELVLTPAAEGMNGAVKKAEELQKTIPGAVILQQFNNRDNALAHERTTGPEILRDTEGQVDFFVAGVGTGGTLSGVGRALKAQLPHVKIVGVEPESSPVLTKGVAGPHKIQGIGANFVPGNYDASIVDEVLTITNEDAFARARELVASEGLLVGISSGAALQGALTLAQRPEAEGKTIVVLFPDGGERYMSTELFA